MDVAVLILRLVVGFYLFAHGAQKLFGWFDGGGIAGTGAWLGSMGFRPPRFWAVAAGLAEAGGGLLLIFGLFHPVGSLAIAAAMLTAIFAVHWSKGLFNSSGGWEQPITNLAVAAALGVSGPGRYSLDSALGISLPEPIVGIVGVLVLILGLVVAFALRRTAPVTHPTTA